jgi:hypothetical protein
MWRASAGSRLRRARRRDEFAGFGSWPWAKGKGLEQRRKLGQRGPEICAGVRESPSNEFIHVLERDSLPLLVTANNGVTS